MFLQWRLTGGLRETEFKIRLKIKFKIKRLKGFTWLLQVFSVTFDPALDPPSINKANLEQMAFGWTADCPLGDLVGVSTQRLHALHRADLDGTTWRIWTTGTFAFDLTNSVTNQNKKDISKILLAELPGKAATTLLINLCHESSDLSTI